MTDPGAYLQLLLCAAAFLFWWLACAASAIGILASLVHRNGQLALACSVLTAATCWAALVSAHQILLLVGVG
ncbi:hypothetical protein TMCBR2_gp038c [Caulobacter phage TMCBR2]|uniref:Uncharacterized protein n=1 Tax=Caulobacter phage TMCBR2 TaxID=3025404 RepID=A0AAF0BWM1_9CAUD|nr:hypothetical protein TMCBR2_gp038c [Caulobacter phage TMCBR2]